MFRLRGFAQPRIQPVTLDARNDSHEVCKTDSAASGGAYRFGVCVVQFQVSQVSQSRCQLAPSGAARDAFEADRRARGILFEVRAYGR